MARSVRVYMRWTNGGVGVTGLTPTFTEFQEVGGSDLIGEVPSITEISKGKYYFDFTLGSGTHDYGKDISYEVDGGTGTLDERYYSGVFGLKDSDPYEAGALKQTIHFKDNGNDIASVIVKVYNDAQDEPAIYPYLVTDANGEVDVYLPAGTYNVVGYKSGYTFSNPYTMTITAADVTQDFTATQISVTEPADPTICRVVLWILDYDGVEDTGAVMTATCHDADSTTDTLDKKTSDDWVVSTDEKKSTWDSVGGYHYIDLIRNTVAEIEVKNSKYGKNFYTIPNQATVDFTDLVEKVYT